MTKIRINFYIFSFLLVISVLINNITDSKPIQILENKPGYIAVYIRHGNEPLEDINPALADAFHENIQSQNGLIPLDHNSKDTVDSHKPQDSLNSDKNDVSTQSYMVSQTS